MILVFTFVSGDKSFSFRAQKLVLIYDKNVKPQDVPALNDFLIQPQTIPGGKKRDKIVPTHVNNDTILNVVWEKLLTQKEERPYTNEIWIRRRIKELEDMGWDVVGEHRNHALKIITRFKTQRRK